MARSALPIAMGRSYPSRTPIGEGPERAGEGGVTDVQLPRRLGAVEMPCL